jgi:hypothetical protein
MNRTPSAKGPIPPIPPPLAMVARALFGRAPFFRQVENCAKQAQAARQEVADNWDQISMCRTAVLILTVVLLPLAAGADVVRRSAIPDAYLGTWAADAGKCGESDKGGVVLAAKAYTSSAANCTVDFVSETAGARGAIYSARLQCSNPASKSKAKSISNLIIRPESTDRISIGSSFDSLTPYRRCPATGSAAP